MRYVKFYSKLRQFYVKLTLKEGDCQKQMLKHHQDDFRQAQEFYDCHALQYIEHIDNDSKLAGIRELVFERVSPVRDKDILCIGCGSGAECKPYRENGAKVTGIDSSNEFIAYAKQHYGHPGIEFLVMDYEKTSFEDNCFDCILSIMSIAYKPDLTKVLLELKRLLRPGGKTVIAVHHPVRKMIKYANFDYFLSGLQYETCEGVRRFNYYRTIEEYYRLIRNSGLDIEEILEPRPRVEEPCKTVNHVREDLYPHALVFVLNKRK